MSSICRRIAKPKKVIVRKVRQQRERYSPKKYHSFNVFTNKGKNVVVEFDTLKTCEEVQSTYPWALCVGGIE